MRSREFSLFWLRLLAAFVALCAVVPRAQAAPEFLEPEQAFKVGAAAEGDKAVVVSIRVAPGYYLYREPLKFTATGADLGLPALPQGKVRFDETFNKNVETYRELLRVVVPVEKAAGAFTLVVTSQGCADAGLCYPPMQSAFRIGLAGLGGDGKVVPVAAPDALDAAAPTAAAPAAGPAAGDGSVLGAVLQGGRFWTVVGAFFVAGLLLSLTPCVLPMLPIVSSIIAGHGSDVSRGRGLALAAAYSLGMAAVYTAFGVAAGLAGEGLAAALQAPWVLVLFALGLVALALSMLGVYELQLPSGFTQRMTRVSQRLPAGRVAGVCAMGGVSALIVSPCVAAPLAGALVYLSQTRDVWLGGTALFSLAAGMSVPLLLVGASAGALLPKAGPWMTDVKAMFGLLLLGVALYTVQTLLPPAVALLLWGALLVAVAVLALAPRRGGGAARGPERSWRRAVAALFAIAGLVQWVGAATGATDPWEPLAAVSRGRSLGGAADLPRFAQVRSVDELDAILRDARGPVMLDFYADWCVSCKEMERFTFTDPAVQAKLRGGVLLKADVTQNSPADRALLKRFGLFGPPGTIFFAADGREVAGARVVGFQDTRRFLETLRLAGL